MSEELVKWLLGGLATAFATLAGVMWKKTWSKDAEVDAVREQERLKQDELIQGRDAGFEIKDARINELMKELQDEQRKRHALELDFEKKHGETLRKATSIVMAMKYKREPRVPRSKGQAVDQLKTLSFELKDINIEELLGG